MVCPKLPKSIRKFLRRKKSEIRRQFLDAKEAESKIEELVKEITGRTRKKISEDDKIRKNQQSVTDVPV